MAPSQKVYVQRGDRRVTQQSRGYLAEAYHTLTSPDNASVVRSVAIFGAAVAFFSSSWSELVLPPL